LKASSAAPRFVSGVFAPPFPPVFTSLIESPAIQLGFQPIDLGQIGPRASR